MAVKSFKDLLVWQKSRELSLDIYATFVGCRDYGFKDQIQRASISIMNNIAEGYGRRSDRALAHFLIIARGSAAEVESMLTIATELTYLTTDQQRALIYQTEEVGRLLTAFRAKLKANS
jgi:four helix bundle protein